MAAELVHRGPSDMGAWADFNSGFAVSHSRLSILDLSTAGSQPMHSASRRFVLAFNGEIYNHLDLRARLNINNWAGHSDTETLTACIDTWGLFSTLDQLVGMFAIALWDRKLRKLSLVRDRFGEKPLFYGSQDHSFLFASELKAFTVHPSWKPEVDRDSLALYLRYGYVPTPHTIWRNVHKLLPGSVLTIDAGFSSDFPSSQTFYWQAKDIAAEPPRRDLDDQAAVDELDRHLRISVASQMSADVPLGAFLSGGIDSSTIVAQMQALSPIPVHTFSIGFHESGYDEAIYAKKVAHHLGTQHHELYLLPSDAQAVIPMLPEIYDEPFGDSSQIPTFLVSKLARNHVTVCLSGDAGDELFGGYNRHVWGPSILNRLRYVPPVIRRFSASLLSSITPHTWDLIGSHLPRSLRLPMLGDRLNKMASVMGVATNDELYRHFISHHLNPESIVIGGRESITWADLEASSYSSSVRASDFTERMLFCDLVGYLCDDILAKVDRASMAVSLETRVPMLDHRIVEFAWSLPLHMKIRHGEGKWLLRQVLYRYVPKELYQRPKQGFAIPIDSWLRGPLRDWAETLLNANRLRHDGYLRPEIIRHRWQEHLSGTRNWQHFLWNVLMFQAWQERWL
jgi:asparagine synthase (glutamine-hydrolysing)